MRFDHAIIAVYDLAEAQQSFSQAGFTVVPGGEHAGGLTHNALVIFSDGAYLELMAPTSSELLAHPPPGPGNYLFLFESGEGVAGYAFQTADVEAEVGRVRAAGIEIGDAQSGGRRRPDGVQLRWRTAMFPDMATPFFITDETPRELRVPLTPASIQHANRASGVSGLQATVAHLEQGARRLSKVLGVPFEELQAEPAALLKLGGFTIELTEGDPGPRGGLPTELRIVLSQPAPPQTIDLHGVRLRFDLA